MTVLMKPIGIVTGLLAGILAKKIFEFAWGLVDNEDAPEPKHRDVPLAKLALALVLEGAIFRVVRGLADHGLRHGVARATGSWPGPERPEED